MRFFRNRKLPRQSPQDATEHLCIFLLGCIIPRDAQRGANKQAKNTCPRRKWEKKPGDKEISINGKARFSSISSGRGKRKQLESAFTPERGEQIHRCWQT